MMRRASVAALEKYGFAADVVFAPLSRLARLALLPRVSVYEDRKQIEVGYLPMIHSLNYLLPAAALNRMLGGYDLLHVVSGTAAAALPPIAARRGFVAWLATTSRSEVGSLSRADGVVPISLSKRLNLHLLSLNDRVEKWILGHVTKVCAVSRRAAEELAGLSGREVSVLYPPVDLETFRPGGAPSSSDHYILAVGRLDDPRKDFGFLVRAVQQARRANPNLRLFLAGPGRPTSAILRYAADRLGDAFRYLGFLRLKELADAYRGAVALALSSVQEGLGIVVAEAMACGTPVVVRSCGGADELVEQGVSGYLLPSDDLEGFSRALCRLAQAPLLRNRMGELARSRAKTLFSRSVFEQRLMAAHREVTPLAFAPR
jgi:glycosyltransferase involved in cell wall biosynthesis